MSITERQTHTFAELLAGREAEFPTLARAATHTVPAHDVVIYWMTDANAESLTNFQQIFRTNCKTSPDKDATQATAEALTELLTKINLTLRHGDPGRQDFRMWCGGYRHYLGRDLTDDDKLILRPLSEPFLRVIEQDEFDVYLDYPIYEWIAETSLQVVPA